MIKPGRKMRLRYLVRSGYQLRYMASTILIVFLVGAVVAWTTYFAHWTMLLEEIDDVHLQQRLAEIFEKLNRELAWQLLVLLVLLSVLSVFASHKVAGPAYRFRKTALQAADGDLRMRVLLRKGDELGDVAEAMDRMLASIRGVVTACKEAAADLEEAQAGGKDAEVRAAAAKLNAALAKFKTG